MEEEGGGGGRGGERGGRRRGREEGRGGRREEEEERKSTLMLLHSHYSDSPLLLPKCLSILATHEEQLIPVTWITTRFLMALKSTSSTALFRCGVGLHPEPMAPLGPTKRTLEGLGGGYITNKQDGLKKLHSEGC